LRKNKNNNNNDNDNDNDNDNNDYNNRRKKIVSVSNGIFSSSPRPRQSPSVRRGEWTQKNF